MFFQVTPRSRYIEVIAKGREGVVVFPTYVPGSYLIRELERNLVEIEGVRISKNKFYVKDTFRYLVYASSKDQREAISTDDYLFINPPAVFPFSEVNEKYCVKLSLPSGWKVATTLRQEGDAFCADNYHDFADSPIEASPNLKLIEVDDMHVISTIDDVDVEIVRKVVGEADKVIQPSRKYVFHFRRSDKNFGGIEHRDSSAIVVPWNREELAILFAHEYFHRLNVKELYPADLRHNYEREVYTDLLWFSEGFTDYFAVKVAVRSGAIERKKGLERVLSALHSLTFPGAKRVSLAESSRTAWIKYYRQDENFLNSSVSYYDGGLALAFYADAKAKRGIEECFKTLRERSRGGAFTFDLLDKAMRELGFEELELAYKPAREILEAIREELGLEVVDEGKEYYGLVLEGNRVKFVEDGSPADRAGLLPDDQIVAVNGTSAPLRGEAEVLLLREGRVKRTKLSPGRNPGHSLRLKLTGKVAEKVFMGEVEGEYKSNVI
ncbi:MAG: PDZ domain-containing protein [Candidatus Aramenus sp.]|nr:PDZ domain-containing protein [Candidatus Aramenus sp.]